MKKIYELAIKDNYKIYEEKQDNIVPYLKNIIALCNNAEENNIQLDSLENLQRQAIQEFYNDKRMKRV